MCSEEGIRWTCVLLGVAGARESFVSIALRVSSVRKVCDTSVE